MNGKNDLRRSRVRYPCGPHCPRRKPGCQDHCPDMEKAKAENDLLRTLEQKQNAECMESRKAIRQSCKSNKNY